MAYDRRALVGIGGWLAFFIITLVINAVAATIIGAAQISQLPDRTAQVGSAWTIYVAVAWLLVAIKVAGYGYLAWRLNARQTADTPHIVIIGLGIVALVPNVIDIAAAILLVGVNPSDAGYALGEAMVRPAIYWAIWTAYLLRSERVANTYTDDDRSAEAVAALN